MADVSDLDLRCINTIRTLSMDAVQAANSGHPGTPMALAPVAYCLWQRFLRFDPEQPIWANRDRFVLSNGHASMLLYSMLHLTGVKAVKPGQIKSALATVSSSKLPWGDKRYFRREQFDAAFGSGGVVQLKVLLQRLDQLGADREHRVE